MRKLPEFTISFKSRSKSTPLVNIKGSDSAYHVCRKLFGDRLEWREELHVLALSHSNNVIGSFKVSEGGLAGTVADPKVIFQFVLLSNASRIIVTHNHPSGNLRPSEQDKRFTDKLSISCKNMDIELVDHLIITANGYLSFADEGLL